MKVGCFLRGVPGEEAKQIEARTRVTLLQAMREKDAALKQSVLNYWLDREHRLKCVCMYILYLAVFK